MRKLSRKEWVAVGVAVCLVVYMFFGNEVVGLLAMFNGEGNTASLGLTNQNATSTDPSIQIEEIAVGDGAEIQNGSEVAVNYVLRLSDGTLIQDSKEVNAGQPFIFTAGSGGLIPGWEMGIIGMKEGGKRLIVIPPELGFGPVEYGNIPANSTLLFEIDIVSVSNSQ